MSTPSYTVRTMWSETSATGIFSTIRPATKAMSTTAMPAATRPMSSPGMLPMQPSTTASSHPAERSRPCRADIPRCSRGCITPRPPRHSTMASISRSRRTRACIRSGSRPSGGTSYPTTEPRPPASHSRPYVFLCMPPRSVELVANATRYLDMTGKVDFLNHAGVQNYLESVILQPSYKVAMFFDHPWWTSAKFPPKLANHVYGPTVTDIALRQVYYFGNNGTATPPVYGLLASYDDMEFTTFWQQMQLSGKERRKVPLSQDYQPLLGPAKAPAEMERMLRLELAKVHFTKWPPDGNQVPPPLETSFLNWGLNPFGAGYHGWSSHYDIGAVMQNIRTPTYMATGLNAGVFIVGEAFSNDQGWFEGAFCTAESVLVDFLGLIERAQQGVGPGPRTENEVGRRIGGAPTGHLIGPCGPRDRRRLLHNEIRPCVVGQLAE